MQLPEFLTEDAFGSIRLSGHRIALEHFVYFDNQGFSPEMLLGQFPHFVVGSDPQVDCVLFGESARGGCLRRKLPK